MDKDGIRHIAALAELSLSDAEVDRLAVEIGNILAYVAELEAVDTSGVVETVMTPARDASGWRPDVLVPGISHADALREAPQPEHDGFGVPAIIE